MSSYANPPEGKDARGDAREEERKIEGEDEEYKICREIIDQATEANKEYREAYELYLSKVVDYEAIKWGAFSGSVKIRKWDKSGFHPLEVIVTLEYKTGDAINTPYANYPVDKEFSNIFRKYGWKVEEKGTMIYGYRCWRCGKLIPEDKLQYDQDGRRKCPECGATSTRSHQIRLVKGSKWLYAYKKVRLSGGESREQLREIMIENVRQPLREFAGR
jgi:DNA-directed RNA polymerase subunit RPC12/RpoP